MMLERHFLFKYRKRFINSTYLHESRCTLKYSTLQACTRSGRHANMAPTFFLVAVKKFLLCYYQGLTGRRWTAKRLLPFFLFPLCYLYLYFPIHYICPSYRQFSPLSFTLKPLTFVHLFLYSVISFPPFYHITFPFPLICTAYGAWKVLAITLHIYFICTLVYIKKQKQISWIWDGP
jgi:hypothetical protein